MAQLKYDKEKRMLWVRDGNEVFPIFTLANLNGNNTRLTSEGFLEVKNSNTDSWETVTDSDGQPISLMGAPGKDGETPVVELSEDGVLTVSLGDYIQSVNIKGAKGDKGDKGDPGPPGDTGSLLIHGGEVVQNYTQGDSPRFSTIVEGLPAGTYTISCNLASITQNKPNNGNYGYPLVVMYNSDDDVIGKASVFPQGVDIVVSEVATLKICPVRYEAFNIQNGELVPNVNLAIDISEKYTFKNIWVLPKSESKAVQQLQTTITNKQDKESNELLTSDKTVVGAINELYRKHVTSFAEVSVSYKKGENNPHIHKLTYVPAGTYKLEGKLNVTADSAPDPFGGCAVYVSTNGNLNGINPYDVVDCLFQFNEEFTLTSAGHLYIVFADFWYLSNTQGDLWPGDIQCDAEITLSNLALYTIGTASTYSLRAPAPVSYIQIPLESAVLIPRGQSFKKYSLISKTISDLDWSVISEEVSDELCKQIYTEVVSNDTRQLDICGKSYIQITVLEDSILPQLPTLQELYDRQSAFYNYMKENTTAFITVSNVDFIAEEDTWVPKS